MLNLPAFSSLISKTDKYLAGWQALLLSPDGHIILLNSALDDLPTYVMVALLVPQGVVQALDKCRHAFLWIGEDKCSGTRCLIAWGRVCRSKQEGGLGVKDIAVQNGCLLLKLLHKLHHPL